MYIYIYISLYLYAHAIFKHTHLINCSRETQTAWMAIRIAPSRIPWQYHLVKPRRNRKTFSQTTRGGSFAQTAVLAESVLFWPSCSVWISSNRVEGKHMQIHWAWSLKKTNPLSPISVTTATCLKTANLPSNWALGEVVPWHCIEVWNKIKLLKATATYLLSLHSRTHLTIYGLRPAIWSICNLGC